MRRLTTAGLVTGLALLVSVAGCATENSDSQVASVSGEGEQTASTSEQPQGSMREFKKCMREHGVDLRSEKKSGGPVRTLMPASPKSKKALKECADLLPRSGKATPNAGKPFPVRKVAKCLREHGIDVKVSTEGGTPRMKFPSPDELPPNAGKVFEKCGLPPASGGGK